MTSPQPQRGSRQQVNSQLSKNTMSGGAMTSGAHNLKTPLIGDKISKKGHFAMTPDIHTKTYAERQSMAAIGNAAGGLNPLVNPGSVGQAGAHTFSSIHQSAKQPSKA